MEIWLFYVTPLSQQEIDLYTVTREELTFSAPYSLTAKRNDYVDAIVSFFTVEFTKCHKPTGISTCKELRDGEGGGGSGLVAQHLLHFPTCVCSSFIALHPLETDCVLHR